MPRYEIQAIPNGWAVLESYAKVAGFHSVAHFFGTKARVYAVRHRDALRAEVVCQCGHPNTQHWPEDGCGPSLCEAEGCDCSEFVPEGGW